MVAAPSARGGVAQEGVEAAGGAEVSAPGRIEARALLDTAVLEDFRQRERRGRKDVLRRIVGAFLQPSPEHIEQLREAAAGRNARGIQSAAHTLKSSSACVGAIGLSKLCSELEDLGRSEVMEGIAERVAALQALHSQVCEALNEECGDMAA